MNAINEKKQRFPDLRLLLGLGVLLLVMLACICSNGPTPTPEFPPPVPPGAAIKPEEEKPVEPSEVAVVVADAWLQRRTAEVWAELSDAGQLARLDTDQWYDLLAGSQVTTDDRGEGWVKSGDCMDIYIFRNSRLRKSACPKSHLTSGNITCAEEGTSAFNNKCASLVIIQTPSLQTELAGTWLVVTYLPDQQLSILQVLEGSAQVWPVLNAEVYDLGAVVEVGQGSSWFSVPDNRLAEWSNLPVRTTLADLPPEINELLQPWQEQEQARAAEDGVPIPGQPGGEMIVQLFGGGGPLEDKRVEDAVVGAVDWPVLIQEIFPNQTPSILVELPEERRLLEKLGPDAALLNEVRAWPYDPERSRSLLAEAGYPDGLSLRLLYPAGDEQLTFTAERMTSHLNELGVEVFPESTPFDIIHDRGTTTMAAGEPILWLSRQ